MSGTLRERQDEILQAVSSIKESCAECRSTLTEKVKQQTGRVDNVEDYMYGEDGLLTQMDRLKREDLPVRVKKVEDAARTVFGVRRLSWAFITGIIAVGSSAAFAWFADRGQP